MSEVTTGALPALPTISGSVAQSAERPVVCGRVEGVTPFGSANLSERGSVFRARGLGPRGRRWKSCRSDHLKLLSWPNISGIRLLSGHMQVRILPAAPLPGGVKVARRPVKPFGVGASPTLAAILNEEWGGWGVRNAESHAGPSVIPHSAFRIPHLRKAGRYKLAAPVPKTGSVRTEVGRYPRLPPL